MDIWNAIAQTLKNLSHHSNMRAPEPSKNDDLLAFQTIITMLSLIQSPARLTIKAPIGTTNEDRRALRLLDALSTVLIRRFEITAVVARPYDESTGNLQVFASVVLPSETEPLLQPSKGSNDQDFWSRVRNFAVATNPRNTKINGNIDSLMNSTSLPIIGDRQEKVPEELVNAAKLEGEGNTPLLNTFLETNW
jgi:hypothetical protein